MKGKRHSPEQIIAKLREADALLATRATIGQVCQKLAIDVARRMTSEDVLERLAFLMVPRGVPEHIRSDTGAEFASQALRQWLAKVGVKTLFIEPGSLWENGYVEPFNGKLRHELLDRELFYTLLEAKVLIERWRQHYNLIRPHSALGYRPPVPEAIASLPAAAADAALGALPQAPPGALPLAPGFFPSHKPKENESKPNKLTVNLVS